MFTGQVIVHNEHENDFLFRKKKKKFSVELHKF